MDGTGNFYEICFLLYDLFVLKGVTPPNAHTVSLREGFLWSRRPFINNLLTGFISSPSTFRNGEF